MLIVLSIVLNLVLNLNHLAIANSYLLAKMKKPEAKNSGLMSFLVAGVGFESTTCGFVIFSDEASVYVSTVIATDING
jgi:hypothetical protein